MQFFFKKISLLFLIISLNSLPILLFSQNIQNNNPELTIVDKDKTTRWGGRFDDNQVEVKSNCDEVELFVNGNSQGIISRESRDFKKNGFQWNVRFIEFGTHLKVVGRKGDLVVTDQMDINYLTQEWDKPYRLLPEVSTLNDDIATVTLVVLDENGIFCFDENRLVELSLIGEGELIGQSDKKSYSQTIQVKGGKAPPISIKLNAGKSVLAVKSEGLPVVFLDLAPASENNDLLPEMLGSLSLFNLPSEDEILHYMNLVADWQLENLPEPLQRPGSNNPPYWYDHFDWTNASFYTGVMAHWRTTGNQKYFDKMMEFSEEINFQPGTRLLHADDHIIGQIYAEIYMENKDRRVIQPMLDTFDKIMETPHKGRDIWRWCDALYMAPPTLVLLSKVTGDSKYIDFMDELWWDATDLLYEQNERLYYRDNRFVIKADGTGRREPDGSKVFWSRGNGWVLGGLARVLEYMPSDYPSREKYENLFREMSSSITSLQNPDGLWRSSLLYPEFNQAGESSGTAFFAYGLAWGVNQGLLCEETYMPYILRSWNGLVNNVHPDGKLGWTQQIGFAPDEINADMSEVYGAGAFLLAGSELVKYVNQRAKTGK